MMIYLEGKWLSVQEGLAQLDSWSKHSHRIVRASCDYGVSKKCRKEYTLEYRHLLQYIDCDGKLPCISCHHTLRYSGRSNPNTRYIFDDNLFSNIDTPEKAYLLGWIASDGHIGKRGFVIKIHQKDIKTLEFLRDYICKNIPIARSRIVMVVLSVNSQKMSSDLCKLFSILPGKKSNIVRYPKIGSELNQYFVRGYFEGDGCISYNKSSSGNKTPKCHIRSNSDSMLKSIQSFYGGKIYSGNLVWERLECLKFLKEIYSDKLDMVLDRKYKKYLYWNSEYEFYSLKNFKRGKDHCFYGGFNTEHKLHLKNGIIKGVELRSGLSTNDVLEIRELYSSDVISMKKLAIKFNTTKTIIDSIINNKIFRDDNYKRHFRNSYPRKVKEI